ncbi:MAG: signal peptidase II [Clostridia bacterium]|nr:signal peptidase II [Clostridia bacterium]
MSKRKSYIILAIIVVVGFVIDLITKLIFARALSNGEVLVIIPKLLEFRYVENTGAAYGMLSGKTWLLIVITLIFIIGFGIYDFFNHANNWWYLFGMGMILSGAVGNFVDRIFLGFVRDFIDLKIFNFVFNIADALITFGIICLGIFFILEMIKEAKMKKESNESNDKE